MELDLSPEPDLCPLYPSAAHVSHLLSPLSGLTPIQKISLVNHSLSRACVFGDLTLLTFLLSDPYATQFLDLHSRDEDGLGFLSVTILGFGTESERDVEREECVRLLVSEGADVNQGDNAGWTALHHAALLAPPTLVSYLLTHNANVMAQTHRRLTALDIIRAHTTIPGRESIALLLEEGMREEGWQGSRLDIRRQHLVDRTRRQERERALKQNIAKLLDLSDKWWGEDDCDPLFSDEDELEDELNAEESLPLDKWDSMLVYSPYALPQILQSLIVDFKPTLRNSEPANGLYLLCRFACLWGDPDWVEDLIVGAVDRIEETVYASPEDLPCLTFWMFNCTMLLHLLRCDNSIVETVDGLGLFGLLEELVNAIFVFIIRTAERQIDPFIETSLLDHVLMSSEFEGIQFQSEWSFFRSLTSRKRAITPVRPSVQSINAALRDAPLGTPPLQQSLIASRPISPPAPNSPFMPSSPGRFNSLRQSISTISKVTTPTQSQFLFAENIQKMPMTPQDMVSFLSAFHGLLCLAGINPVLIIQAFSQIFYWTSCEMFNRILTRKKYLCRSRAAQMNRNASLLETWAEAVGLPSGVTAHFSPVYELLHWLQSLSSLDDFASLVAIIQGLRNLNPFQMRRAVKDYKYEVGEDRMNEECAQYLAQLQKDWERHRVKVGVENMRKEFAERDRDDGSSDFPSDDHSMASHNKSPSLASSTTISESAFQLGIDGLFDRNREISDWLPPKPPPVLGELLESRHMLPLIFPSDPEMLCAVSMDVEATRDTQLHVVDECLLERRYSPRTLRYRLQPSKPRTTTLNTLKLVDGIEWGSHRASLVHIEGSHDFHDGLTLDEKGEDLMDKEDVRSPSPHLTSLHPQPSLARKARTSSTG